VVPKNLSELSSQFRDAEFAYLKEKLRGMSEAEFQYLKDSFSSLR
jgi:hypothetical protein